jgi:uncharacterized protein
MITVFFIIGLTSALISGVTGLAGGVLLLSCLSLMFPIEVVIPLHALVQVLANLSRVLLLRPHIEWSIWRAFNLLTIPAGLLGAYGVTFLPRDVIKGAVGLVVLLAAFYTLKPKQNTAPQTGLSTAGRQRYVILGAVSSLLGMVVGATGPLIAPFFMIAGLKRERFIATKSACQLTVQLIKTAIFAQLLDFTYQDYSAELGFTVCGVVFGTWVAKKVLAKVNGAWLETLIALMLIVLASRMIMSAWL